MKSGNGKRKERKTQNEKLKMKKDIEKKKRREERGTDGRLQKKQENRRVMIYSWMK